MRTRRLPGRAKACAPSRASHRRQSASRAVAWESRGARHPAAQAPWLRGRRRCRSDRTETPKSDREDEAHAYAGTLERVGTLHPRHRTRSIAATCELRRGEPHSSRDRLRRQHTARPTRRFLMPCKESGFIPVKRRSASALLLVGAIFLVWADSTLGLTTGSRTTTETTTVTTTTVSTPTFESETAYLNGHRPGLKKAVRVTSALGFKRAVARAKPGETIDVLGNVHIPGSFRGFNRVIKHGTVNVVFQPGAGFEGGDGAEPAVFID